jgi:hypothetical protein
MSAFIPWNNGRLIVSENGRFLQHENGTPFFWLGDTGWLTSRLTREEVDTYLENRRQKGYNVIQMMVIHSPSSKNAYERQPFINEDFTKPDLAKSADGEYSFWEHVDYIVDKAAEKGMYMGLVAVWGSVVKHGHVNEEAGKWLAERYKDRSNIVWLIGGDERGTVKTQVWLNLANAIREVDSHHLMTFHPFGRTSSSTWFHNEHWLDFNMFQSGHRRYNQVQPQYGKGAYRVKKYWDEALDDDGAVQMQYLKNLILSRPYFERIPDQTFIQGNPGYRYDYLLVSRGNDYILAYVYTGRPFELQMGVISGTHVKAWWYDPRNGESREIGTFENKGVLKFDPPGEPKDGNDWVLVLDDASKNVPYRAVFNVT